MTTYQVGDVAETNDGRLAFVAKDDGKACAPLQVIITGGSWGWHSADGTYKSNVHPNSLRRLVWRDTDKHKRVAQAKREQAAKLLAEAEQLEQSANQ